MTAAAHVMARARGSCSSPVQDVSSTRIAPGPCAVPVRQRLRTLANVTGRRRPRSTAALEDPCPSMKANWCPSGSSRTSRATRPGKLADAEVILEADVGPLSGLTLSGFAVWERRDQGRNVTFPARAFTVNGARRSLVLLRPAGGDPSVQDPLRQCIPRRVQSRRGARDRVRVADPPDGRPRPVVWRTWRTAHEGEKERHRWKR
jgi:hypothetical protein